MNQKDETIKKYKALLSDARQEMQSLHKRHEDELKAMQSKLHSKTDDAFNKFKTAMRDTVTKPSRSDVPTNDQVRARAAAG